MQNEQTAVDSDSDYENEPKSKIIKYSVLCICWTIVLALALSLVGLFIIPLADNASQSSDDLVHTTLPPGWTLVSNSEAQFAPKSPAGCIIDDAYKSEPMTRSWAIERAWQQYEYNLDSDIRKAGWQPVTNY